MSDLKPLFSSQEYRETFKKLLNKYGLVTSSYVISGFRAWIYETNTGKDSAYRHIYLKFDSSESYHYARYDIGIPDIWPKGAKTINLQLWNEFNVKMIYPLVVFADPRNFRCIEYWKAREVGLGFEQRFNGEKVLGIGTEELRDFEDYLHEMQHGSRF